MKNDYYSGTYIPGIVKWGKITLLLGIFAGFLPALVMAFRGYMPPVSAIIAGTLMQISVSGAFYIVEPISYFPILGIPGTYLTFLSGNTSNMRVPCSSVAQEAAGVEMGTEEGSIISTIGIATSILVNVVILTVGAVAGSVILNILPVLVNSIIYECVEDTNIVETKSSSFVCIPTIPFPPRCWLLYVSTGSLFIYP